MSAHMISRTSDPVGRAEVRAPKSGSLVAGATGEDSECLADWRGRCSTAMNASRIRSAESAPLS